MTDERLKGREKDVEVDWMRKGLYRVGTSMHQQPTRPQAPHFNDDGC